MKIINILGFLTLISVAACTPGPIATPFVVTATGDPDRTPLPSSTPLPDSMATQDAERLKMTVQAFQTETASAKATERAGAGQPTSIPSDLQPITTANAIDLAQVDSLETGVVYGASFSNNGDFAAVLTETETIILDLRVRKIMASILGDVFQQIAFPPAGSGFAAGTSDGLLLIMSLNGSDILTVEAHDEAVQGVVYSPDGNQLLTSSLDGRIRIWDAETGELMSTIESGDAFGALLIPEQIWFSPDGKKAAVYLYSDSTLWVGDAASLISGSPSGTLIPWLDHAGPIATVEISPDWQHLAWMSRGTLQLMTTAGERIGEPLQHEDWIMHTAFSPEEDLIFVATATYDGDQEIGIVRGYDLDSGATTFEMKAPGFIFALETSPGAKFLVTGHSAGNLEIWSSATGEQLADIKGHQAGVTEIGLVPDGSLGASIDASGRILIWSVPEGEALNSIDLPGHDFYRMHFGLGGSQLTVITEGGQILIYGIRQ